MKLPNTITAIIGLLSVAGPAQTVTAYFPNDGVVTGSTNAFPWNVGQTSGYTTVQVYPAAQLGAQGVLPGMHLSGLAFVAAGASAGTMTHPTVRIFVGHAAATTGPTLWINNLADPTVIWDTAIDGPVSVLWTGGTWTPLPFRSSICFFWDGVRDFVVMVSQNGGYTTPHSVVSAPAPGYPRHGTTQFMPPPGTAQTTTGVLAPRLRVTFDNLTTFTATTSGPGAGDLTLTLGSVGTTMSEGYTLISATTGGNVGSGALFGITPDFVTFFFIQTPPAFGNPVHWLASPTVPGVYPYAPFSLPSGFMAPVIGQTWDLVSLAFSPGFAAYEVSCVARVTF